MIYSASLDRMSKFITISFLVATAVLSYSSVSMLIWEKAVLGKMIVNGLLPVIIISTFLFCWLYAPRYYEVDAERLIIHRKVGRKEFKLTEIQSAELLQDDSLKGMIRTAGVGGLFGYFGRFYHDKHGKLNAYLTQRKNPILIEFKDSKKILISPDNTLIVNELVNN